MLDEAKSPVSEASVPPFISRTPPQTHAHRQIQIHTSTPHTLMKFRTTSRKRPFHSDQRPPKCGNAPTCSRGQEDERGNKGSVGKR